VKAFFSELGEWDI
jgi:hypothetical protein